jgi:tetratricopeptide (TPR) repeat protein
MKISLILCMFLLIVSSVSAGTPEEQAMKMGLEAIELMENDEIDSAIKLLEKAQALDPDQPVYTYEIAFAHYLDGNLEKAINILEDLIHHENATDQFHQMLGNMYSLSGEREQAIAVYETGLKAFPRSGILHLERGNMELLAENYYEALNYYEDGILVDPAFPSNYYWAARIYANTTEEVWCMIYGEIFMNLERNTTRTEEISTLLYEVYKDEITIESDTSYIVSFSQHNIITPEALGNPENFRLPFGVGVYEIVLMLSVINETAIDIHSLNRIRTSFVENYYNNDHHLDYPIFCLIIRKSFSKQGTLKHITIGFYLRAMEKAF